MNSPWYFSTPKDEENMWLSIETGQSGSLMFGVEVRTPEGGYGVGDSWYTENPEDVENLIEWLQNWLKLDKSKLGRDQ